MPAPAAAVSRSDRERFESAIQALEAEIANVGVHLAIDGAARQAYARQIKAMADELRSQAASGTITWSRAAAQAQDARNAIMDIVRGRSTPVGRALAEQLKREGRTLNELIARKTLQLHGPGADFGRLSPAQQNAVYAEIVEAAGRSNPRVTSTMRRLSRAGRGLIVLSIGLSVYTVATADDPVDAAGRELAVTGAGIGGRDRRRRVGGAGVRSRRAGLCHGRRLRRRRTRRLRRRLLLVAASAADEHAKGDRTDDPAGRRRRESGRPRGARC